MTREEVTGILEQIQYEHTSNSGTKDWTAEACETAIRSLEAWDEIINHLEATAKELLDREDEKQSYAFAKGITFSVSMIKNHMKEVEE